MSSSDDVKIEKAYSISLDSLPIEIFLLICERIDANTLIQSLMYVNKRIFGIISDSYLWRKRIMRKFNDCNIAFIITKAFNENEFNWKQFAWHTESEYDLWSKYETNTTTTIFKGTHFSEVDAVMMTSDGNHCISSSRDRSMCLWNTTGMVTNPVVHKIDSHTGWIWNLGIYDENHFLSCSWDSTVKLWNTNNFSADTDSIQTFSTDAAVLSIASKQNFVAAGLYTPKIIAFDPRESGKRLFELNPHKRSIIDLCLVQDYYLVSLSEDKTLSIWDLRTHRTVKSIHLIKHGKGFPMCASYYDNILFVGDSLDVMYWLDCSHGSFDYLETVQSVKPVNDNIHYKLNCIKCTNYGSIINGGNEGAIYILTPTNPPKIIAKIGNGSNVEITSIDYKNNTLVVGYVNSEVQVWKKKEQNYL